MKGLRRHRGVEIFPDEIFLDSHNLPDFDTHQFEGRFERPISPWSIRVLSVLFGITAIIFAVHAWTLQIVKGAIYNEQSAENRLRHVEFFAERGVLYDRNGTELAWNEFGGDEEFARRHYIEEGGFSHLLGFVNYPSKDVHGFYYRTSIEGRDGVEKVLDDQLRGSNGVRIIEIDALGEIQSASVLEPPLDGSNVKLSVDAQVQAELHRIIKKAVSEAGYSGGSGVIMDVNTGELLTATSYPEFSSEVITNENSDQQLQEYEQDNTAPFLNRAIAGLYIPGSIIKPFLALAALEEGIINTNTIIVSTGQLEVPNPYDPDNPSIFKDWKAHGRVNMQKAIAVSSNVYFYNIGGGHGAQEGLGIERIERYLRMFGFGQLTGIELAGEAKGVIPNKQWKAANYEDGLWRLGDTYNTAIGQYGLQVTPLQAARAIATIANNGRLLEPKLTKVVEGSRGKQSGQIDVAEEHMKEIRAGMHMAVEGGTAIGLNIVGVNVAAKTGTAQVSRNHDNAWVVGFFPYENPRYSFAVILEKGPSGNQVGGVAVMRQMLEWMIENKPEYLEE